jgi:hypothetical protein
MNGGGSWHSAPKRLRLLCAAAGSRPWRRERPCVGAESAVANNFARLLVVAQSFESGMPKKTAIGPLRETNLRHQFGLEPAQFFHFFGRYAFAKMSEFRFA